MIDAQGDALRTAMQQLVRRFGALASDQTPCGQPLPPVVAHALMVLRARGELAQVELGAELGVDKSNVARACARLVRAGHATQRTCAADGRVRRIALTPRGQQLAMQVELASRQRFEALLAHIPRSRRRAVVSALRCLATALAHDADAARPRTAPSSRKQVT